MRNDPSNAGVKNVPNMKKRNYDSSIYTYSPNDDRKEGNETNPRNNEKYTSKNVPQNIPTKVPKISEKNIRNSDQTFSPYIPCEIPENIPQGIQEQNSSSEYVSDESDGGYVSWEIDTVRSGITPKN